MRKPIKKILSSLIGFSLIISAAGCNRNTSGTTQSDVETTTAAAKTETTAAQETTAEETSAKVENQSIKYRPGDVVTFGKYEQDNEKSNGKEDIEWFVLAREDNKILVLSRSVLDSQPYNDKKTDVTWETCSLRKWLNGTFYESAFDEEEKSHIIKTDVPAGKNPEYDTPAGNPTSDNVFLLSFEEYNEYLKSDYILGCAGTDYTYAKANNPSTRAFVWWLRTPGKTSKQALGVVYYRRDKGATVDNNGIPVNLAKGTTSDKQLGNGGVRPAMWIELPDSYTTPDKHLNGWVEGYATVRVNYQTQKGKVTTDVPNIPCQIHYTDGFPSNGGEVRDTGETSKALREWIINNVGEKNLVDGAYSYELIAGTGRLEKTS